ncbi:hypothetical protein [Corynebacterium gerontici]|uniref:Uncharacterized protein n=1 Tax=Corynebacterium gerontici TaxID=2079234 RepID=A0A3G6J6F8_9CORY|nr:hypothetical protein [Corynebacterium gerontici]AZA11604.1 hypothetical protein CGERO_06520 [Corynebacterium gerontici]
MPDRYFNDKPKQPNWPLWLIIGGCAVLVLWLRWEGVVLAAIIAAITAAVMHFRPDSAEVETLRASVLLSIEDIQAVLSDYEHFLHGTDPEAIADRTMLRPALADETSVVPEIERFHELRVAAERFCARVQVRFDDADMSVAHLEGLLQATDRRAAELQQAWTQARHVARKLAP